MLISVLCKYQSMCLKFIENGMINIILEDLKEKALVNSCLEVMKHLVSNCNEASKELFSVVVEFLNSDFKISAAKVLQKMVSDYTAELIANNFDQLFDLLDSDDENFQIELLKVFNCIAKNQLTVLTISNYDFDKNDSFISRITQFIESKPDLSQYSIPVIASICTLSSQYVREAIECNILNVFEVILKDCSEIVKYLVYSCISILISYADFIDISNIKESKILEIILENFEDFGENTVLIILTGLLNGLIQEEESGGNQFRNYLASNCSDFIEHCLSSSDYGEEIQTKAEKVYEILSPD
ncbi:hypothetical protein TVAG_395420 [Trichomonas vaginalis G3]|uniref:Armadillo repeat-containing domain-containing protein n=1 Tax=Trichomonas vaginalis (strain ATCC PRA-98 / G3) TaxID=412133 RepID=A2F1D1_TRIV3|nr:armadillo (ARM) repeat-containing protein family [Trichomonas vaginalis G3]EAY01295.1 hypothetical protein TVAG_395420 [Trichomonas vaginalis G3]KAI5542825.1 armadillo (ARM) repeat-containing protein family [Trichomonas vaginalis G3]|eukprot:XP_001330163.1 hypothetical protein [Trichomonas vaginalis G3]